MPRIHHTQGGVDTIRISFQMSACLTKLCVHFKVPVTRVKVVKV